MSPTRTIAAGLGVLALALPAAAAAKQPAGHAGHGHSTKSPKTPKVHTVSYVLKGTWSAADSSVVVTAGNGHVRRAHLVGTTVALDLSSARFTVRDGNGDGVRDAADVQDGDNVVVKARGPRDLTGAAPLVVRRVVDQTSAQRQPAPDAPEAPEAPSGD